MFVTKAVSQESAHSTGTTCAENMLSSLQSQHCSLFSQGPMSARHAASANMLSVRKKCTQGTLRTVKNSEHPRLSSKEPSEWDSLGSEQQYVLTVDK